MTPFSDAHQLPSILAAPPVKTPAPLGNVGAV